MVKELFIDEENNTDAYSVSYRIVQRICAGADKTASDEF